jgi:hypothetical protein
LKNKNDQTSPAKNSARAKRRWKSMRLTHVGDAKDVIRQGGGKNSPNPADPGEVFKPSGQKA